MVKLFNARLAERGGTAHISIPTTSGRTRQFPVVDGILSVPDDLAPKVVGAAWKPYRGQTPLPENHEALLAELRSPQAVDKHHAVKE